MYAGVPSTLPGRDRSPLRAECVVATIPWRASDGDPASPPRVESLVSTLARPQSITWTSPNDPTMMFDGFRSRWITPRAWA